MSEADEVERIRSGEAEGGSKAPANDGGHGEAEDGPKARQPRGGKAMADPVKIELRSPEQRNSPEAESQHHLRSAQP